MPQRLHSEPYVHSSQEDSGQFMSMFPSETGGDGRVVENNRRTGAAQGKASFKRKAHCHNCGFLADLNRDDNSGGSFDGNGNISVVATSATYTTSGGTSVTENYGNSTQKKGGGCPFCGSKNIAPMERHKPGLTGVQPAAKIAF